MARKGWGSLSAGYRARLEKAGISRADYESGQGLSKARGHAKTPEHPGRKIDPQRYPEYLSERQRLMREFEERKAQLWGDKPSRSKGRPGFSSRRSKDNVRQGKMSNKMLRWALEADEGDLIDAITEDSEAYAFIGYH